MIAIAASGDLITELREKLSSMHPEKEVVLSREALILALNRFLHGEIKEQELVEWANLLEAEDQICFEPGHENVIADVVFQIATPEINAPLIRSTCAALVRDLQS